MVSCGVKKRSYRVLRFGLDASVILLACLLAKEDDMKGGFGICEPQRKRQSAETGS